MGKTYKKLPPWIMRAPKGKKQALQAKENGRVRHKAIPPDAWEDKIHDKQAWMPYQVARKMYDSGKTAEECFKTLTKKFKLSSQEANEVVKHVYYDVTSESKEE